MMLKIRVLIIKAMMQFTVNIIVFQAYKATHHLPSGQTILECADLLLIDLTLVLALANVSFQLVATVLQVAMENGLSCTTPYLSHVASPVSIFDFLICLLRVNIAMNRVDTFVICCFGPVGFNTFLTCTNINICQNVFCCLNCTATVFHILWMFSVD